VELLAPIRLLLGNTPDGRLFLVVSDRKRISTGLPQSLYANRGRNGLLFRFQCHVL
jgi:hypothetical protein